MEFLILQNNQLKQQRKRKLDYILMHVQEDLLLFLQKIMVLILESLILLQMELHQYHVININMVQHLKEYQLYYLKLNNYVRVLSFQLQHGQVVLMLLQVCKDLNVELVLLVHGLLCNLLVKKNILNTVKKLWMLHNYWQNNYQKYLKSKFVEILKLIVLLSLVSNHGSMFMLFMKY